MTDDQPKLGWWLQLVRSSAFENEELPAIVKKNWGTDLVGASVCEIDWEDTPVPESITMYGTVEDGPPDFEDMAESVRSYMNDGEYFVFLYVMAPVISDNGFQCIAFTNNTFLIEHGKLLVERAITTVLTSDRAVRKRGK